MLPVFPNTIRTTYTIKYLEFTEEKMSLKVKLVLFTLAVVVLPLMFIGYYSVNVASTSLQSQSFDKLEALADAKQFDLNNRVNAWFQSIASLAASKDMYNTLTLMENYFTESTPGKRYDTSNSDITSIAKFAHPKLLPAVEKLGFADAMLIDTKGRICLTVRQGSDWGADLLHGELSDTNLSHALQLALKGRTVFSDQEKYPPHDNAPAAFLVAPIFNTMTKKVAGALAFQVAESNINALMNSHKGMGQTGRCYLVGPDGLLRSDMVSRETKHLLRDVYKNGLPPIRSQAVREALAGKSGAGIMPSFEGQQVLAAYAPIQVGDTTWAIISEIDKAEAFGPADSLRKTTVITEVATLLVVLTMTLFFLSRLVFRPLASLENYAGRVAEGDYEASVQRKLPPELARVRDSLISMVENLKKRMEEVDQAKEAAQEQAEAARQAQKEAEEAQLRAVQAKSEGLTMAADTLEKGISDITRGVNELSQAVGHTNSGAEMQKDRTISIAAAMDEMTATVHEMVNNSHDAAQGADNASTKAREGSDVVRDSIGSMDKVREMTDVLTQDMTALSERVESIGRIMTVINDIADQTNLLALNAAIEAARAGDAGRGFAVVADEVRKLAEKTMLATKEVDDSITAIQEDSRRSSTHVDTVGQAVDEASTLVATSGQALEDIVDMARSTSERINAIATAVQQQSEASQEIGQGIGDVSRISEETATNSRQADHGVRAIQGAAENLEQLNRSLREQARLDA
jgi:methyl-accepting chemotaxis protein